MNRLLSFAVLALLMGGVEISNTPSALAHGKEIHDKKNMQGKPETSTEKKSPDVQPILDKIGQDYRLAVGPTLENKCGICHGIKGELPWYSVIPGVKQLIEWDMAEGKKHLDLSQGFPFGGHGKPKEDLQAISKVVKEGAMPPLRYKIMHWDAALTSQEEAQVLKWVKQSLEKLTPQ